MMKKNTQIKLILVSLLLVAFGHVSQAENSFDYEDFSFNIIDDTNVTAEVIDYFGTATEISIPTTAKCSWDGRTYNVVKIAKQAFFNKSNLTKISMPTTITYIDDMAFMGCSKLGFITVPSSVKSIGNYAFAGCTSMTSASVKGLEKIGANAFDGCTSLKSIELPDGLTTLGAAAFKNCKALLSINIPYNLSTLFKGTFDGCEALSSVSYEAYLCNTDGCVFEGLGNLASLFIRQGVYGIPQQMFKNCSNIKSVKMANSVRHVQSEAFSGCSGIETLTLNDSLSIIDTKAFYGCKGITTLIIPKFTERIENAAFFDCEGLKSLKVNDTKYPLQIKSEAFFYCNNLEEVTLGNNVSTIDTMAFASTAVKSITIPASTTKIGACVFLNTDLQALTVDTNNPVYDSRDNCNAIILTKEDKLIEGISISEIPEGIKTIGSYAFAMQPITEVVIPNSVEDIEQEAFYGCAILNKLSLGTSLASIGENAFFACNNITEINALATLPPACFDNTFTSTTYDKATLYVPEAAKDDYAVASVWKNFKNQVPVAGIESVETDEEAVEIGRYDIYGRELSAPSKGVNIVKMSNGKTHKVFVK